MSRNKRGNLCLGSNVVELLLPQKRPFLMVDGTEAFALEPQPTLEAFRHVSANEPVFEGHFRELHLWPAAFTIEGLGQTGILLIVVLTLRRTAEAEGGAADQALEELRNLERGFGLQPGFRPREAESFTRRLREGRAGFAVGTSVEMKFPRPVFAGQRIDYRITLTGEHAGGVRFEAEASVDGAVVAAGVIMGALVRPPAVPAP